jgi:hypothetical protein
MTLEVRLATACTWNNCAEFSLIGVHQRRRVIGSAKETPHGQDCLAIGPGVAGTER